MSIILFTSHWGSRWRRSNGVGMEAQPTGTWSIPSHLMTLLYLCVQILLGCYPGQSPTLWPKWHMLCVRIRSNLPIVYAKLSTTVRMLWKLLICILILCFLLEVNNCYVIFYLQGLKKQQKNQVKAIILKMEKTFRCMNTFLGKRNIIILKVKYLKLSPYP